MNPLRVAILRADDHHHRYLESLLRGRFDVVFTAVEPGAAKVRRLLRRRRYRDYAYYKYHEYRRLLTGKDRYRREYFRHDPPLWSLARDAVVVESINAREVAEGLATARPDVTVVIGCSILRRRVLAAAGPRIVNVHGGHLPDYRGNHCVFFALYNGEPDKVGVSIHHVSQGVDTGPLIEVVRPPVHGGETAEHLYCRAEKLALTRLVALLERVEQGEDLPAHPQEDRGRTYRTRDRGPGHDLRMWLRRFTAPARTRPAATRTSSR
ncbi:formyl transferase [Goodfellowiella coeruleoviolacea]|uniref:phosphoribosylglycinamide formyltransferase 1 n=1 Tax=Goodfellowiella coeruleoviolacea TaxID=334858 RepID=A0AAE3GK93_9PSEU|nr:formyl transferase [Goodfellowiella coeruleoviolacea]MCP2167698.1 Formyl transferase [Goodfellowiella coeruleoviolacea]